MKKAASVDEYVSQSPQEVQKKLLQIRNAIQEVAPEAEEKISYGMPYYGYKGRLAYFAYAKKHIGLYIPPPIINNHSGELKDYTTSVSAVQFPLDKELPIPLIKRLVRARVVYNENSADKK